MKKYRFISGLSALAVMAMPLTAYAANPITETTEQKGEAVITTEIAPSYIVTIPADTTVKFHDLTTDFGKVELTKAQLDPGKVVKVTVNSDGELNNAADDKKVIPYTVMAQYASGAEGEVYVPFKTAEQPLEMDTEGQKFALSIEIGEEDWNKAYAGSYSDTVTFNVSYEDAPTPEPEP